MVSAPTLDVGGNLVVEVPATNVGDRRGAEVVQLYVAPPPGGPAFRLVQELLGFAKVVLDPGETATVSIALDARAFARWSAPDPDLAELLPRVTAQVPWTRPPTGADHRGWILDPGAYELRIGRSSADIVHVATVEVPTGGPLDR